MATLWITWTVIRAPRTKMDRIAPISTQTPLALFTRSRNRPDAAQIRATKGALMGILEGAAVVKTSALNSRLYHRMGAHNLSHKVQCHHPLHLQHSFCQWPIQFPAEPINSPQAIAMHLQVFNSWIKNDQINNHLSQLMPQVKKQRPNSPIN